MKTTKTYLSGCTWCNGIGDVASNYFGMSTTPLRCPCPVCKGSGVITITEVTEGVKRGADWTSEPEGLERR